jgi:hypothetical protein
VLSVDTPVTGSLLFVEGFEQLDELVVAPARHHEQSLIQQGLFGCIACRIEDEVSAVLAL